MHQRNNSTRRQKFLLPGAEDDTVNMLRQDIHELINLFSKEIIEDANTVKKLQKKLKKIHKDMEIVERQFNKLKSFQPLPY